MGSDETVKRSRTLSIAGRFLSVPSSCRKCCNSKIFKVGIAALLFLLLRIAIAILYTKRPVELPNTEPWQLPAESLQAMIYFKEESHALVELVLHLYSQGFSHVRLVDNNSKHALPEALKEFRKRGLVTLLKDKRTATQKHSYVVGYQSLRRKADWVLTVDADEFPYATKSGSLLNYLVTRDEEICSIALPMRFFGASGREDQPNSILQGFTHRRNFTEHGEPLLGYKTTSRTSCTLWPAIHHAAIFPSAELRTYNAQHGFPRIKNPSLGRFTEEHPPEAVVNHYRTQSAHFYREIKVARGNANPNPNKKRTMDIFYDNNKYDNSIFDDRLSVIARQRFPELYGSLEDSLALKSNVPLLDPWPRENVLKALDGLARHQGLAILDAASGVPGQFGIALRNAALLDPTWDCIVRVPPGHVESVHGSGITKLCATREAQNVRSFNDFASSILQRYGSKYTAYVAMEGETMLGLEADTAGLRESAKSAIGSGWKEWSPPGAKAHHVAMGTIWLLPKSSS